MAEEYVKVPRSYYQGLKDQRDAMLKDLAALIDLHDSMAGQLRTIIPKEGKANIASMLTQAPKLLREGTMMSDFEGLEAILAKYRDDEPDDPQKLDYPDG